jgi:cytochrome P450 PksS
MTGAVQIDIAARAFKADPWPVLSRLRAEGPIAKVRAGRRAAWLITSYSDAVAALKDPALLKDKSRAVGAPGMPRWLPASARALGRNMLDLDDPDHRRLRKLVQPAFSPRLMERLRDRVAMLCTQLLDTISDRGSFDLIADYAAPVPTTIIAELLGIPAEDRLRFRGWTEKIVIADTSEWAMLRALPSIWAFVRYLKALIEEKRRNPGDDVITGLLAAEAEGDRLSADEVMAMAFLLLVAGHETTVNLIGNGILALTEEPSQYERLRGDPQLAPSTVEEVLRFSGPLMISTERYAGADMSLAGVEVLRGSLVYVSLASANRDDKAFPDADRFDIGRSPNSHLAFGDGRHFCLGSALARMEGELAVGAFVRRFREVRLATEPRHLQWKGGVTLRGLKSLPVQVS